MTIKNRNQNKNSLSSSMNEYDSHDGNSNIVRNKFARGLPAGRQLLQLGFAIFAGWMLRCVAEIGPAPSSPSSLTTAVDVKVISELSVMQGLADSSTFLSTLEELYTKYGAEIAAFRPQMRMWCEKTQSCKFGDYEAEMLYLLIREYKPQHVFEMAPNRGFSSHWILEALHKNDNTSKLFSFDIHDSSVQLMDDKFKARWVFTLADYAEIYDNGKLDMGVFDFIFIDALHEPAFARGYCERLLANHKKKSTIVAVHDIVADKFGGGRESEEVYKFLAFANNARNVFTMSRYAMPNMLYAPKTKEIVPKLNQIRANMGIVKPCINKEECKFDHDLLFFPNNDAPTIFFSLN